MDKRTIFNHFGKDFSPFYKKYLPSVKSSGNGHLSAICPFHDDMNPSFSIEAESGKYFCHGCGKGGDPIHFYAKISDLDTRRDFGKILNGIASDFGIEGEAKPKSRMVKAYDYRDAEGNLIFQTVRMEPKDFRQRQPDGKGGWVWSLKGVEPVLYRLPEIMAADEILICEGEKDCDNLASLGFQATTSPMGAKKWKDSYSDALAGKAIVLIPDNDTEGREHMVKVGQSLSGKAASIKWLDLPNLPAKGDVSDFIESFNDKDTAAEQLAILIENAKPYEPPKKRTIDDLVMRVADFKALDLPTRQRLLNPWLKENSIVLVSGWRGIGKTFFALGLLNAISRGEPFGPWECEKAVPCLFLDGEMSTDDDMERIHDLGLNSDILIYSDALGNHWGLPRANLTSQTWRESMTRILKTRKVKLWVIDNLASLAGGLDENAKKDWDPVNQWLLELRFSGISTLVLHHVGKDGSQRGTSAREDNLDCSLILRPPSDYTPDDGCRFVVHFSKARVNTADLKLIADTEFKLILGESGRYEWTWANVRAEKKKDILRMMDEGIEQKTIAETLGITKGYITKIKKWAFSEGLLSKDGKLNQSGFEYVSR
ncbi:MAG: AAA family ATPase [Deltaproteobacteria bacterium]|nr:AAA family ATPase [Deltaproteobacteria bacterium]